MNKKLWLELRDLLCSRFMVVLVLVNLAVYVFARDVTVCVLEHSPWFYRYVRNSYLDTADRDRTLRLLYQRYTSSGTRPGPPAKPQIKLDYYRDVGYVRVEPPGSPFS